MIVLKCFDMFGIFFFDCDDLGLIQCLAPDFGFLDFHGASIHCP